MKRTIIAIALFNIGMIVISALALLLLPIRNAAPVIAFCTWAMRISWVAFALWFFMPYIKRGISYLIKHRED